MDVFRSLWFIAVTFTGLTSGAGVLPDVLTAAVGGTVTFITSVSPPVTPFLSVAWEFVNTSNVKINIITSTGSNFTAPQYVDRITLFRSNGSLELKNLALNDSGQYIVTIVPNDGPQITGQTTLNVSVPVSNVTVTVSGTDLVEFNSSVNLSCSSSGSSPSFLWLNGSSEVTATEGVQLSDQNRTVTIVNVSRYNQQRFRCRVSNAVSSETSEPVKLSISFGPDDVNLKSPSEENYVTGSEVDLSCSAVSSPAAQFTWFLNRTQLPDTGAELRLTNIQMNQSGDYSCQAFNPKTLRYQTSQPSAVIVLAPVPVSNVTVTVSGTDLVEFNSSVSLSCSSSGSSPSFLWLNGSSEVTATDRVQLTGGGRNLTIVNVSRYDQGPFRCRVSNAVSSETSEPVKLSISFGPDDVNLKSPSEENYVTGSDVDLSCSAVSSPAAQFTWFLNRTQLPDTGAELRLTNIQMNQSGDYSCQAFNPKTLRYQTSQPSALIVLAPVPVSNVTVTVSGTDLVEFNSSVSLSCSSSGSSPSFLWLNGSSEVTATDRVQLTGGGRNLTIVNVSRYDQGPFRCRVSNAVSSETSEPVKLSISFGPNNVNLKSPSEENYVTGSDVDLSCSAVSSPAAQFTWFLNRTQLPDTGAELRLTNIQMSQSGDYSCQAFNPKTLRYQTSQPSALIVLEPQPPTGGCSGGCIAGIVIAVVVVVVVVILLVYFLWIKPRDASTRTGGEGQDNATSPQNQELHYAHISFQNKDGGTVQMGPEDNQTQYAEINAYKPQGPSSPPTYDAHMHRMRGSAPQPGANGAHGAQVHRN